MLRVCCAQAHLITVRDNTSLLFTQTERQARVMPPGSCRSPLLVVRMRP